MKIAVTGSSGLVGSALCDFLEKEGHEVFRVKRPDDFDVEMQSLDRETLETCDAMVHLAGVNLTGQRWSDEFKKEIYNSRVKGTDLVARGLARLEKKPRVLVTASAVGYYGPGHGHVFSEDDGPGEGFLAGVCRDWEAAAAPAEEAGIRVVKARLGVVLSKRGGALEKMLTPFKLGLGGPLGSGRQAFPWIHLDDLVAALWLLLRNEEFSGPVNVVAPQIISQKEFALALGKALHRPAFFPLPAFVARLVLGEMADEVLLSGQAVKPAELEDSNFEWKYPRVEQALAGLVQSQ